MTVWLAYLLVFVMLVGGFSACASTTSDGANPDAKKEEKPKPSEPFRY